MGRRRLMQGRPFSGGRPARLGGPGAAALEGCGHAFPIAAYFSFILNIICLVAVATLGLF